MTTTAALNSSRKRPAVDELPGKTSAPESEPVNDEEVDSKSEQKLLPAADIVASMKGSVHEQKRHRKTLQPRHALRSRKGNFLRVDTQRAASLMRNPPALSRTITDAAASSTGQGVGTTDQPPSASLRTSATPSREHLWKQGTVLFGDVLSADGFVVPTNLRPSDHKGQFGSGDAACTWSPTSSQGKVKIRAIIRSANRAPVGISREYDLNTLHSALPASLKTPWSARSSQVNSPMSTLAAREEPRWAYSPSVAGAQTPRSAAVAADWLQSPGLPAFPLHYDYTRAFLPILASVMMFSAFRKGDTINLPVPHPRAWPETLKYVYTGREDVLCDEVRNNILYFGGVLQHY